MVRQVQPYIQSDSTERMYLMAEAEEMRRSLKSFVTNAWSQVEPSPYKDGWVIDALCDHLEAVTRGYIRFLLINIPPRTGKSTICSVLWPAWDWLHKPEDRFLCASYSLNLAIRDNLKKRNLIESRWFQSRYGEDCSLVDLSISIAHEPKFALSDDQNAKRFFMNDKLGYHLAVSVGSTTTGEGGSVLLGDDMHSVNEAHSDVERESALTWFKETFSNRMNDPLKDSMVVVGQRIHELDVSGLILEERPDWVHLNLPMEYEPDRKCFTSIGWSDPRQNEGDLLWPERFDDATLARYKRDLGTLGYAGQYQQRPAPAGGAIFRNEWIRRYSLNGEFVTLHTPTGDKHYNLKYCRRLATVDLAISQKQTADYTVIATWCITPNNEALLMDIHRNHMTSPQQQQNIKAAYAKWRHESINIESVAYQLALVQQLLPEGVPVRSFSPVADKVSRASTAAIFYEGGQVYHPKWASWLGDFEKELLLFPRAAHDDCVDVASMICALLFNGGDIPVVVSSSTGPAGPRRYTVEDEEENARLEQQQDRAANALQSLRRLGGTPL